MEPLDSQQILAMYDQLGAAIAVIDRDMKIIYCNQQAQKFYSKVFGEREYLGYSTRNCHSQVKPMNFYHANFPGAEGGEVTVLQFPYWVNGKVEGILEINVESSLAAGGRGEHRRVFQET